MLCSRCGKSSSARCWKCSCGVGWTSCQTHRVHGYACVAVHRTRARGHVVQPSNAADKRLRLRPRMRRRSRAVAQHLRPLADIARRVKPALGSSGDACSQVDACDVKCNLLSSALQPHHSHTQDHNEAAFSSASSLSRKRRSEDSEVPSLTEQAAAKRRQAARVIADARSSAGSAVRTASSTLPQGVSTPLAESIARLLQ